MSLKSFLKQSAKLPENQKIVVSERFIDEETGMPEEWEIKAITSAKNDRLLDDCTKRVPISGKRGQFTEKVDRAMYGRKLAAACTVYPNLDDVELQNSYGVLNAEDLIGEMLLPGELGELSVVIGQITGFDTTMSEKVDNAKN